MFSIFFSYLRSNIEDSQESPGPDLPEQTSRNGLDPKYLRPASSGNQITHNKGIIEH